MNFAEALQSDEKLQETMSDLLPEMPTTWLVEVVRDFASVAKEIKGESLVINLMEEIARRLEFYSIMESMDPTEDLP